ncbi:hypothetical protein KR222_008580 [Zaprionus bogoriensis]|nr:hypothetical protein KR222_008580 [Zaprionus bogoriensis]
MRRNIILHLICAMLITSVIRIEAHNYKLNLLNSEIYEECENQPENVLNINGLFDLSNFHKEFDEDEVRISGNISTVWDIERTDRVQATVDIFRFDRGSWQPTQYSVKCPDFCKVMYMKNDLWYPSWIIHVTNREEIQSKCLNEPGITLIHEPFNLNLVLRTPDPTLNGRFKLQIKFKAIDALQKVRPNTICFEIKGDMEKIE